MHGIRLLSKYLEKPINLRQILKCSPFNPQIEYHMLVIHWAVNRQGVWQHYIGKHNWN